MANSGCDTVTTAESLLERLRKHKAVLFPFELAAKDVMSWFNKNCNHKCNTYISSSRHLHPRTGDGKIHLKINKIKAIKHSDSVKGNYYIRFTKHFTGIFFHAMEADWLQQHRAVVKNAD